MDKIFAGFWLSTLQDVLTGQVVITKLKQKFVKPSKKDSQTVET